ncbi:MAG: bacillithiol biosynthesis deacetylase BshB1 [Bacteroidia bacterium]|nr:bacillithiol biosynthesis deacetylase BshB1 [Bacteroidia bacterium]
MKLDILAFGAHPDDVELACSGTLILHARSGLKTGIVDLTKGELGTRGTDAIRLKEAAEASKVLGLAVRENLGLIDGFIQNDSLSRMKVVRAIRKYQPEIILCNAVTDRHPDHGHAAKLVSDSIFLAGLVKVVTTEESNISQKPWKTKFVYHYIQDNYIKPDFVLDVSSVWDERMKAIMCYSSQFFNPDSGEPETAISTKSFIEFLAARAREFGRQGRIEYAEGFTTERIPVVKSLSDLL